MAALIVVFGFLIGIFVSVVTIMATVRIITNAGYSGWWILVPFVTPIVGWVLGAIVLASASLSGGTGRHVLGIAVGIFVIEFICWLASWAIFVKFAFADWPVMQAARARQGGASGGFIPRGGGFGGGGPAGFPPPPAGDPAPNSSSGSAPQADPGWYRSGMIGAGEQSYWDGAAWTAQRRWHNNSWVELPPPAPADAPPQGAK